MSTRTTIRTHADRSVPDETAKMVEAEQKITYIASAHAIMRLDAKLGDKVNAWATEAGETWNVPTPKIQVLDAGVPRINGEADTTETVPLETEQAEIAA